MVTRCAIVSQERDNRERVAMVTTGWQWCGDGANGDNGEPLSLNRETPERQWQWCGNGENGHSGVLLSLCVCR